MGTYILRRMLQMVPVLFGATFLVFFMVFALPGDPVQALGGDRRLPEAVADSIRDAYNLNDPFFVQYFKYVGNALTGDLGQSFTGRSVADILRSSYPVTVRLALVAFAIEIVIGIGAGIMAGLRRGSFLDNLVLLSTTLAVSIPVFVLGYVAQLIFGVRLGWFPVAGINDGFMSYVMPAFVLATTSLAYAARLLRTSLVENLRADYVRTATSKGLKRSRVVGRHALRNSLIPVVTFLGADLGALMAGAIVTETIFNIPGIGNQIFRAIQAQEGSVVVGLTTVLVIIFIIANLIVDLLYGFLDPRIRYE